MLRLPGFQLCFVRHDSAIIAEKGWIFVDLMLYLTVTFIFREVGISSVNSFYSQFFVVILSCDHGQSWQANHSR